MDCGASLRDANGFENELSENRVEVSALHPPNPTETSARTTKCGAWRELINSTKRDMVTHLYATNTNLSKHTSSK